MVVVTVNKSPSRLNLSPLASHLLAPFQFQLCSLVTCKPESRAF